jgi:hypothetical protein
MDTFEVPTVPFDAIASKLGPSDDPAFWREAMCIVAEEFLWRLREGVKIIDWAMEVGACSHWNRPHQTRWTAAGGFAYPEGYKTNFPELDWSLIFLFRRDKWIPAEKLPAKRIKLFRVAIPSRTARHNQAAIHARWSTGAKTNLFGLRKLRGEWECVAATDRDPRSKVIRRFSR